MDGCSILFLIGPPNSGKSTQADLIVQHQCAPCQAYRITPGDWLRHKAQGAKDSPLGQYISNNWNHDALAPLVTDYVDREIMDKGHWKRTLLVIDGYPRTMTEVDSLARICRGHPIMVVEMMPDGEEEVKKRGHKRQRQSDDTDQALSIRLHTYHQNMDHIRPAMGKLGIYHQVDAIGQPEEVLERIKEIMRKDGFTGRLSIPPTTEEHLQNLPPHLELATPTATAIVIQQTIQLCESTRLRRQFCGSHPISLERQHLSRIRQFPYMVSLKADGLRYFCLVWEGRLWFMNRKLQVWRGPSCPALAQLEDTLVDGELILDQNLFIVLDCIAVSGRNCMHDPILERLRKSVPLGQALYYGPLIFRPQEYVDRSQLPNLLKKVKERTFKLDGIIFTPTKLPYRLGIDFNMFKWKETSLNTVDFLYDGGQLFCKMSNKGQQQADEYPVTTSSRQRSRAGGLVAMGELHKEYRYDWLKKGLIVECRPVRVYQDEIIWEPIKSRTDKPHPNIDWVANNVIHSIRDNITVEEVVGTALGSPLQPPPPQQQQQQSPFWPSPNSRHQHHQTPMWTPSPRAAIAARRSASSFPGSPE